MPRHFTLPEAEALLPHIERLLEAAVEAHLELTDHETELAEVASQITFSGGMEIDPVAIANRKLLRQKAAERVQEVVEEIEAVGCQVKDLESGLLDFPALLGDREVLLCWQLGEPRIDHWHGLEEGFGGRKPITTEFGPRRVSRPN